MIHFINNNFEIGDPINLYCDNGSLITGDLVEIGDGVITVRDENGAYLVLRCKIPEPICFSIVKTQYLKQEINERTISEQISSLSIVDQKPMSTSLTTRHTVIQNYIRFREGKLLPDGVITLHHSKVREFELRNLSDQKKYSFSNSSVIEKRISNSIKAKKYIIDSCVNFIIDPDGKICFLHNLSVDSLLMMFNSKEDKNRQIIYNYVRRKLEMMMPGGCVIEIGTEKEKCYKLTDEERCQYLLRLLNLIVERDNLNLDDKFKIFLLDLKVKVTEKLIELKSDLVDSEALEMALISYLASSTTSKRYLGISETIISSRYSQLANIQIQLSRPRETIIKNAHNACLYAPNDKDALAIKEKAEKLPRDIWHDNRDIQILNGESAISGVRLDGYHMDQNRVSRFLIDMRMADQTTSNRIVDCIKDYYWTILADDSKEEKQKKEALNGFLKLSFDPQSPESGISLLHNSLYSEDQPHREIAWYALICIGTASKNAWNLLLNSKGMENLYIFFEDKNRFQTYQLLNKVSDLILDTDLPPYKFLRTIFNQRRDQIKKLLLMESKLFIEEIRYFDDIIDSLDEMMRFQVLNSTEKNDILSKMYNIIDSLKPYNTWDDDERILRLNEAADQLIPIINLVRNYPTFFGSTLFSSPLDNWQKKIKVTHTQKKSLRQPKFSVYANPPYIQEQDKGLYTESFFNICIENIGQQSADGYRLDITLTPEDVNIDKEYNSLPPVTIKIGAGKKDSKKVPIPMSMHSAKVINASIDAAAFFGERWLPVVNSRFTLYRQSEASDSFIKNLGEIAFNTSQPSIDKVFKGRESDIEVLRNHYLGKFRNEIYILYGLSRTGKTSIALNLMKELEGKHVTSEDGRKLLVIPFSWPIDELSSMTNNDCLWSYLIKDTILIPINENKKEYEETYNINIDICSLIKDQYDVADFTNLLNLLNKTGIYPFFVLDEFQYLKKLLVRQNKNEGASLSEAFVHSIRQKANQGLASFLFAGTYEIKDLMHNPVYGLNKGQFGTTKEKMVNKIETRYAEELMTVMGDKLQFTREAIQYIHKLSYDVPYFIQIICFACANYAMNNHRNYIGYPELNHVINCLTGEESGADEGIARIPEGCFNGNMIDSSHPMEEDVLRYITLFNRERLIDPRPVGLSYIKDIWADEYPNRTDNDLRGTLDLLIEKEIIKDTNDREYNETTYSINVDLFRRWFTYKEKRINN